VRQPQPRKPIPWNTKKRPAPSSEKVGDQREKTTPASQIPRAVVACSGEVAETRSSEKRGSPHMTEESGRGGGSTGSVERGINAGGTISTQHKGR